MNSKTRSLLIYGLGIAILGAGFMASSYLSGQKEAPPRQPKENRTRQVAVQQAESGLIPTTLSIEGRLAAYDKVELYSEVAGTVVSTGAPFKVGVSFAKGSALIRIDDEEARLAILAQKSTLLNGIAQVMPDLKIDYPESYPQWERYLNQFDVDKPAAALPQPSSNREKLFIASRNLYTQYYNIKSAEERLSKYVLYAPFSGVLTEAATNLGALVRTGQKLGTLMRTGDYELVATTPMADLDYIKVGSVVKLRSEDVAGEWQGQVKRISDQIDATSQTVQVFVGVSGPNLREGMYLRGEAAARSVADAMRIDRSLLVNQSQVYLVQDSLLRLHPVEVIKIERESAIVRGLPKGAKLLREMPPGAFDGMKVAIAEQ